MKFNIFKKKEKVDYQMHELKCPRCKIVMRKVIKNDVVLDVCDKCNGLWLDDNEIEKLLKFVREGNQKEIKAKKSNKKKR